MSVKILIDSASDITKEEARKLGIEMIPMEILFGEDTYLDGINLLPQEFYEKLIESDVLPKTSQVTPYRFEEAYSKLINEGYEVVVITISSKLSNTYNSAVLASNQYQGKVFVVDSLNAAVGERILCEYALRLIDKGLDASAIKKELDNIKTKINIIAVVDTLEYLKKGGRVSKATAFAGELFSIKPVLSVIDGEVKMIGKARGSKKANNLLNELVTKKGGIDFSLPFGALYSGLSDVYVKKYIKDSAYLWEKETDIVPCYILGSTIGTHVGPGAIGVAFFEK